MPKIPSQHKPEYCKTCKVHYAWEGSNKGECYWCHNSINESPLRARRTPNNLTHRIIENLDGTTDVTPRKDWVKD